MHACFGNSHVAIAIAAVLTTGACGGRTLDVVDGGAGGASTTSGGTGGSSNTGGTGGTGTGGSGGVTPGDSGVCGCVGLHVGWGPNGGNGLYQDSSALEVCNLFVHQRVPRAQDPPGMSCQQQITDCTGR